MAAREQWALDEAKMIIQLAQFGEIRINYWSEDCDGGHSGGPLTFKSLEELHEWEGSTMEWADGPWGYEVNDVPEEPYQYFTR